MDGGQSDSWITSLRGGNDLQQGDSGREKQVDDLAVFGVTFACDFEWHPVELDGLVNRYRLVSIYIHKYIIIYHIYIFRLLSIHTWIIWTVSEQWEKLMCVTFWNVKCTPCRFKGAAFRKLHASHWTGCCWKTNGQLGFVRFVAEFGWGLKERAGVCWSGPHFSWLSLGFWTTAFFRKECCSLVCFKLGLVQFVFRRFTGQGILALAPIFQYLS